MTTTGGAGNVQQPKDYAGFYKTATSTAKGLSDKVGIGKGGVDTQKELKKIPQELRKEIYTILKALNKPEAKHISAKRSGNREILDTDKPKEALGKDVGTLSERLNVALNPTADSPRTSSIWNSTKKSLSNIFGGRVSSNKLQTALNTYNEKYNTAKAEKTTDDQSIESEITKLNGDINATRKEIRGIQDKQIELNKLIKTSDDSGLSLKERDRLQELTSENLDNKLILARNNLRAQMNTMIKLSQQIDEPKT